jgi:PhnB protein
MSAIKPIPNGYHSITPYLAIRGASEAIDFYKQAFGAIEKTRLEGPNGNVGHAEIEIGDSVIMLADECPDMQFLSPAKYGGVSVSLHLYVEDCDAVFQRAVTAGANVDQPLSDKFYGDRSGSVIDPFGHRWYISSHKEDVPFEEIQRRAKAMLSEKPAS